jgi:Helicase conserved C-terminal domain
MSDELSRTIGQMSAWVIRSTEPSPSDYEVGVVTPTGAKTAVKEGDWALVLDKEEIRNVGRIVRVRQDLNGTSIYFDKMHAVPTAVAPSDIGLTPSSAPVLRVGWDDFTGNLFKLGISKLDDVATISDPVYVRDLLEVSVRDDLLGPAGGPEELIVDMSVRDRYLVGKLAPRNPGPSEGPTIEPAQAADEIGDLEDEHEAPIHEPGAEFSGVSGKVDAEADAHDEIDTSNNQSLVPSSFGMTFCVEPGAEEIQVEAHWGSYERVPNDEHEITKKRKNRQTGAEEEVKARVWRRIPFGGSKKLQLKDGPIKPIIPDDAQPEVRIQGMVRTNQDGERLVTLFLVNGQLEPEQNKDTAWVFQPQLVVTSAAADPGDAVFRRRPSGDAFVQDPERDRLALIYRNRLEFAVGHGVSVHADVDTVDSSKAHVIRSELIPRQEIQVTETPGLRVEDRKAMRQLVENGWLDMTRLSQMDEVELRSALSCLLDDHSKWISDQHARLGTEIKGFDGPGTNVIDSCRETNQRLREGMETLFTDPDALEAFRFANRAMALQRVHSIYAQQRRRGSDAKVADLDIPKNRSWRAFQLAFLLLSVPSLADPRHKDRTAPSDAFADLLWFPTGGGKTEAYLGVAAFAMAMRRLKPDLGGLDASRGLSVIMRYTLRLLTLQQFQRATALLCSMEAIRIGEETKWGSTPFTLGLWVGNRVTPGNTKAAKDALTKLKGEGFNKAGLASPAQLTSCPWCGSSILPGRDIEVDTDIGRTTIYCGDKFNQCEFSKGRSSKRVHPGLPVNVVDEEIYHRPPTMMIATVDKFAMMAWRTEAGNLFGRVNEECERHGLLWPGHECKSGHHKKGKLPSASVVPTRRIRPPDLIIQDEFHLISGPLGTMVGLYETAVDELSSWEIEGKKVRPKVVASTATVRRAEDQVKNVFMRKVSIFPPSGLDVEDNFFSVQRSIEDVPGRRYVGICAPGSSRPAVLIRVYTAFLTASQWLYERFGPVADPYMTLVGYFNSLRELGGMKRLAEDDVQTRSYRVAMSLVQRPGLAQRSIGQVSELTSRVSSQDIPRYLDDLELTFKGSIDTTSKLWGVEWKKGERPTDVVLATNMLSVGVDVDRLGLMVVNGQPKGTAEYIQASSRVGRSSSGPGLVASVLTWARPRDLSHYESFEHFHSTFYQYVEAQSVTPFSPRALDRGLTGSMVSILRHDHDDFRSNTDAGEMTSATLPEFVETRDTITSRTWEATEDPLRKKLCEKEINARADDWAKESGVGGRTLVYKKRSGAAGGTDKQLLDEPGLTSWRMWTAPMSMREVEPGVRLIMSSVKSSADPDWRARVKPKDEGDEQ